MHMTCIVTVVAHVPISILVTHGLSQANARQASDVNIDFQLIPAAALYRTAPTALLACCCCCCSFEQPRGGIGIIGMARFHPAILTLRYPAL